MSAFVRNPDRLPAELIGKVHVVQGDATVRVDVDRAISDQDAIVFALGTGHNLGTTLEPMSRYIYSIHYPLVLLLCEILKH